MELELEFARALWGAVGIWALPVLVVVFGVRFYRLPGIQAAIIPRWRWGSMPMWGRLALVVAASLAMTLATSLIAGMGAQAALVAAVPVALSAILGHKGSKFAGHALQAVAQKTDPLYVPSKFRKLASIIVPLNHKRLVDVGGYDDRSH